MSDKQSNLTDKEMEYLQNIVTETLASVCAMADKHNIDRDSMLKYFADMLTAFTEVTSIQNYETKHTNADRIRNMSDEELAVFIVGLNLHCLAGLNQCDCKANKTCDNCNAEVKKWLRSEADYKGFGCGTGDVKMSDLISRSQLLKAMTCDDALVGDANMDFIIDNIKNAPVAYDVDKVVEQLEEERELAYADFDRYVEEVDPCLDSECDDFFHTWLGRAIKVLKAGGKNE